MGMNSDEFSDLSVKLVAKPRWSEVCAAAD